MTDLELSNVIARILNPGLECRIYRLGGSVISYRYNSLSLDPLFRGKY